MGNDSKRNWKLDQQSVKATSQLSCHGTGCILEKINRIYADYNATTPLCPPVKNALANWNHFGNMSSGHQFGQAMHRLYNQSCDAILSQLNAHSYRLFTCGSATEANHWFFHSVLTGIKGCPRVIISAIEHPCVWAPLQAYATQGLIELVVCRMHADGTLDMAHFTELLTPQTGLVSMMLANNEIGTILPIADVCTMAHNAGALVHCDLVQGVGKLPIDCDAMGADAWSMSSHKCYAPTGCGVLLVKNESLLKPIVLGGTQQQGLRAGSVNVIGLHLFALGIDYCMTQWPHRLNIHDWANHVCNTIPAFRLVVPLTGLWNTVALAIDGMNGFDAMMKLDVNGIAVSTGSACSTGAVDASPCLLALGLPPNQASQVIRLSFGYPTTPAELGVIYDQLKHLHV